MQISLKRGQGDGIKIAAAVFGSQYCNYANHSDSEIYFLICQHSLALVCFNVIFEWTEECEVLFQNLRDTLINAPILRAPYWNKIFHVHVYASNFGNGCVLAPPREHKMDFLVSYASRQLNNAEKNYTTTQ